jgi:endonuclease/exonuclease/phosphatase (EEP) superfamily protein YafD
MLWVVLAGIVALLVLRCLPSSLASGRAVPELVSFVPLMLVPLLVCLVLAALWHRRVLLVACAVALAVALWWHRGYFLPTARVSDSATATVQTAASTDDNAMRIMTLNTKNGSTSAKEVVSLVRSQHVEVLCLQELSSDFIAELQAAGIGEVLPYYVISDAASAVSNGGRNGIWTLAPTSDTSGNLLTIDTSSMPAASISVGGRTLRVVSVHPNSPVRGAQDLWDEGLSVIGSLSDYDHAYLIMGDFNSTWDHARFRELLGTSFVDAGEQSGEGFHMTYPSDGEVPSLIEIDHIVYAKDAGIVVSDLAAVEVTGSDHRALLGTLEVR